MIFIFCRLKGAKMELSLRLEMQQIRKCKHNWIFVRLNPSGRRRKGEKLVVAQKCERCGEVKYKK